MRRLSPSPGPGPCDGLTRRRDGESSGTRHLPFNTRPAAASRLGLPVAAAAADSESESESPAIRLFFLAGSARLHPGPGLATELDHTRGS